MNRAGIRAAAGLGAVAVVLAAFLNACAVNPVTGRRQLMLISPERETELGREADAGIVASYGLYPDEELSRYLEETGQRMARTSHRPELEFSFKVLDSPVINAFAVPGGFVYVTRGILPYLGSEAELAGVLGHEIGHITARHTAQRLSQAQLAQLGIGVGSILSETFNRYSRVAEAGVGLLMLSFSRENEREADRLGVEYATRAGWDAGRMALFFSTLERMSPKRVGGLPDWLSTHPAPEERVANVQRMAREEREALGVDELAVNREEYLKRIEGIVYGADPRQGYVADGTFYHPELRFFFPVPEGWTVLNEAQQVQLTSPAEDAVILFTLGTEPEPAPAADAFLAASGITPVGREPVTVNGLRGVRLDAEITPEGGSLHLRSLFVQKGERGYVFHGLCREESWADHRVVVTSVMEGFDALTERARIEVEPERVRIVRAERTGVLREVLIGCRVAEERLEEHALLNGMLLDDQVEAGTPLKVVRAGPV